MCWISWDIFDFVMVARLFFGCIFSLIVQFRDNKKKEREWELRSQVWGNNSLLFMFRHGLVETLLLLASGHSPGATFLQVTCWPDCQCEDGGENLRDVTNFEAGNVGKSWPRAEGGNYRNWIGQAVQESSTKKTEIEFETKLNNWMGHAVQQLARVTIP